MLVQLTLKMLMNLCEKSFFLQGQFILMLIFNFAPKALKVSQKFPTPQSQKLEQKVRLRKEMENSNLKVPCLNCEEIIPYEEIDKHSRGCISVTSRVRQIEESVEQTCEIDFKIDRIRDSFLKLLQTTQGNRNYSNWAKMGVPNKLPELKKGLEMVLFFSEGEVDLEKWEVKIEDLKAFVSQLQLDGLIDIQLLMERLMQLVSQKYKLLREEEGRRRKQQQKEQLKTLIKEKKEQVTHLKNLSQLYQKETESSQQAFNSLFRIDMKQCKTEESLDGKQYNFESFIQGRGAQSNYRSELTQPTNLSSQNKAFDDIKSDELGQRIFYSKCLNQKMKLPLTHPAQKIPISILFKEIVQEKIPEKEWDEFIKSSFLDPCHYLDFKKIKENFDLRNTVRHYPTNRIKTKLHLF